MASSDNHQVIERMSGRKTSAHFGTFCRKSANLQLFPMDGWLACCLETTSRTLTIQMALRREFEPVYISSFAGSWLLDEFVGHETCLRAHPDLNYHTNRRKLHIIIALKFYYRLSFTRSLRQPIQHCSLTRRDSD
jgi:hypothetical protein